jgi:hypothetical protein
MNTVINCDTLQDLPRPPPSHVSRACSNAPVGSHTGSGRTPGNHGQPGGVMQVLSHRLYLITARLKMARLQVRGYLC